MCAINQSVKSMTLDINLISPGEFGFSVPDQIQYLSR